MEHEQAMKKIKSCLPLGAKFISYEKTYGLERNRICRYLEVTYEYQGRACVAMIKDGRHYNTQAKD